MVQHGLFCFAVVALCLTPGAAPVTNDLPAEIPSLAQIIEDHAALSKQIQTGRIECEIGRQLGADGFRHVRDEIREGRQRRLEQVQQERYLGEEEREALVGNERVDRAATLRFLARTAKYHVDYCFDRRSDSHLVVNRDLRDLDAVCREHDVDPVGRLSLPKTKTRIVVRGYSLDYNADANSAVFFALPRQGVPPQVLLTTGFVTRSLIRDTRDWSCDMTEDGLLLLVGERAGRRYRCLLDPALGYRVVRNESSVDGTLRSVRECEYELYGDVVFVKELCRTSYDAKGALESRKTYRVLNAELNCPVSVQDFELEIPVNATIMDATGGVLYRDGDAGSPPSEETEFINVEWLAGELEELKEACARQGGWRPGEAPVRLP